MDLFKIVCVLTLRGQQLLELISPSQPQPTIGVFAERSRKDAQREDLCW